MFQLTQTIKIDRYEKAVQTLRHYNISLEGLPSREDVEKWIFNLPVKTMEEISSWGREAVLVFVPPMKTIDYLKAIDANKTIPGQTDGKNWWPEFWNTVGSDTWKFGITKVIEENPLDESICYADFPTNKIRRTNEQTVAEYERRFAEKSVAVMPPHGYVPTMAGQLAKEKVLDQDTWNAFKRPSDVQFLPGAYWRDGRVVLDGGNPVGSYAYLRCRPWVEGEMDA